MDPKNFVVILLAFCTTLLLGFGVTIIFGTTGVDICKEHFCFIIKDFIQFYSTVFFTFGVSLTLASIFGFIGLVLKNKKVLALYARLQVLTLLGMLLMLCAGIWSKGPVQLRTNLIITLKTYGQNCQSIRAMDQLQSQFQCCGIDKPDDWAYISKNSSVEPPMSCCNLNLMYENLGCNKCFSTYSRGCLGPLRQFFWRFFNIVVLLAAVIALKSTVAILCAYNLIKNLTSTSNSLHSREHLITNSTITPLNITYQSQEHFIKNEQSSTVV